MLLDPHGANEAHGPALPARPCSRGGKKTLHRATDARLPVRQTHKDLGTLLALCASLRSGHANFLCIFPISSDNPGMGSGVKNFPGVLLKSLMAISYLTNSTGSLSTEVKSPPSTGGPGHP